MCVSQLKPDPVPEKPDPDPKFVNLRIKIRIQLKHPDPQPCWVNAAVKRGISYAKLDSHSISYPLIDEPANSGTGLYVHNPAHGGY